MCPLRRPHSLAEQYDQTLHYTRDKRLPPGHPKPQPTTCWPAENIALYERYRDWLLAGGASELASKIIYLPVAGHVLGLHLKPHTELDLEEDFQRTLEYVIAKQSGKDWIKASRNGLNKFKRFLRIERGLGEENKVTPFDSSRVTTGLPEWLVNELDRYQRLMQRNWRDARVEQNIRRFWSGYLRMWRYFVEQRNVQELTDLKRQQVLDYVDQRLGAGYAVTGVNNDLRNLHTFLLFLQEEGYSIPQSLLKMPFLKQPDPLPRYLTDEQVKQLREEVERNVREAQLASHRRLAVLVRGAFYLLWQGGLRLGEVEELRLEDLDFPQKRLSVRDGKGKKDRTVYLTETTIHALQAYLQVRGEGSDDHVFLYRNAPLKRDLLRDRLKRVGRQVGVKVFPHRLRHTCATQLLNAGCRVTSIQRFLGHKKLSSTMIYARAHDQTVAEDYFAAMERVEQRLEILLEPKQEIQDEVVNVQEQAKLFQLIEQLELPELCWEARLDIASQLRELFGLVQELEPELVLA
ncbi:MAG: tyrosine-type recombinase/integrase [Nitrososphaera sp.]|nr:tyrosine-type recombinase/integrase [Nitrososphaera sp.]